MHQEDSLPPLDIRIENHDLSVETSRPGEGRIQNVRTVCGCDEDDSLVGFETVHFNQERVQGLLSFVVPATKASTSVSPDSIDLVDKDDTGSMFLALFEQITHPGGTNTHEHLHEIRSADGKERHIGLTGNGLGQECFPGAWRPHEQYTLGDLSAQLLEPLGIL